MLLSSSCLCTYVCLAVVESQLRTVPPYLVGAVWAVVVTYVSFRVRKRGIPIIFSCLLVVLGYALAVGTKNSHAR